ncbi:MAG TPA: hypothetical protein VGV92_02280 [Gammaproteobacteria bacterium]|nr:hypothetical protein [Gammaproteobacteria bacterium]
MQARSLIFFAVLINLLLSYLMLLYNQPINIDGILYLHAATAYLQQGFHGALNIYPWPFYSVLIAKISTLLNISLLNTGFILNSVFTSVLIIFFILTLKTFGNTPKTLLWGAAVILLCPELNHDRYNILRDIPYYGLFITSLWCYIRFLQTEKISYGVAWQVVLIFAALFRVEGIVFLVITPFITPIITKKLGDFLKLSWLSILLFLCAVICFRHALNFGRLPDIIAYMNVHQFFGSFQEKIVGLKPYLGIVGQDSAEIFLIGGLLGILIIAFITTFGIFSSLLLGYGLYKKLLPENKSAQLGLLVYISINILILCVFMSHMLFMNWRYIFPLALVCLLLLPEILAKLNKLWIGFVYLIYIAISSFGQFGPSNAYLVDAGEWIANNTPAATTIYTPDVSVAFYAQRSEVSDQKKADYSIIVSRIHAPTPLPQNTSPVVSFHNHRGDTAYIFKSKP